MTRTSARALRVLLLPPCVAAVLATALPVLGRGAATAPPRAALPGYWHTVASGDRVESLLREGDVLWSATDGGGVVRWSASDGSFRQYLAPQDGLPSNDVRAFARTADGALWAATRGGLARLDPGSDRWRAVVPHHPGLPSPSVTALVARPDGSLLVGFEQTWDADAAGPAGPGAFVGGGIARYDAARDEWSGVFHALVHDDPDAAVPGLPSENVTALAVDAAGRLWVGTRPYLRWRTDACGRPDCPPELAAWGSDGGGLAASEPGSGAFVHWNTRVAGYCKSSTDQITGIAVAPEAVWATARGRGLQAFERGTSTRLCVPETGHRHFERTAGGLPSGAVLSLARDGAGHLWMGVAEGDRGLGVVELDYGGTTEPPAPGTAGDDTWTLHLLDGAAGRTDALPVALAVGSELVVGTRDERQGDGWGVKVRGRDGAWRTLATADVELPGNRITAVAADPARGAVWFGTSRRGVARLDAGGWRRFESFGRGPEAGRLVEAAPRGAKRITVTAAAADLYRLLPAAPRLVRLDREPLPVEVDAILAVPGGTRLDLRSPLPRDLPAGSSLAAVERSIAGDAVTSIAVGADGAVWVTSSATLVRPAPDGAARCETAPDCWHDGGVASFDGRTWTIHLPRPAPERPPARFLTSVAFDGRGRPWVGTGDPGSDAGTGVAILDAGRWTFVDRAAAGPDFGGDVVTGVARDPLTGDMWLATHHTACAAGSPGCGEKDRAGGGVSRHDGRAWARWTKGPGSALQAAGTDGNFTGVLFDPWRARVWAGAWAEGPAGAHWVSGVGIDATVASCPRDCTDGAWTSTRLSDEGAVRALALDSSGRLWVGASRDGRGVVPHPGGIFVHEGETVPGAWSRQPTDLWSPDVTALGPEGDGMWVGTFDGGAARWRPAVLEPGAYLPSARRGAAR